MPLYFAYGSNMDEAALGTRCPRVRALGIAKLARHRFFLMADGYASVRRDPGADVHGVLFDLALSDIAPLDRYEDVARGLYAKLVQPVVREKGGACHALVYIGADQTVGRASIPGYMDAIIASALAVGLPSAYVAMLKSHVSGSNLGGPGLSGPKGKRAL